ncbi:MAG: hypothetical protein HY921_11980 [Elusimicrobia bacterium]|nr:hypothetical protein [Elusimicrobiota bacterium]
MKTGSSFHPAAAVLACFILGASAEDLGSESVTLMTYYPAPSGVYVKMITTADAYLARDAGSVGIGTVAPGAKLEVRGDVKIVDGSQGSGKVLTSDAAGLASWQALLPTGAVMFFDLASCPSGWAPMVAARGRYLVGLPAGGALSGTAGTALSNLENRAAGRHWHPITDQQHSHGGWGANLANGGAYNTIVPWQNRGAAFPGPNGYVQVTDNASTGITATNNNAGSVAGTNAPYLQLLVCRKL